MFDKNMLLSHLVMLLLILTFSAYANAEVCSEQRCVEGQCITGL